jgi:hypothetical protein
VDQAKPEDQIVPRDQQKRRYDANLGGDELLLAAHVHQISDEIRAFPAVFKSPYQRNAF